MSQEAQNNPVLNSEFESHMYTIFLGLEVPTHATMDDRCCRDATDRRSEAVALRQAPLVGRARTRASARASKTASPTDGGTHTWSSFAQFLGSRKRGRVNCASVSDETPNRLSLS